MTGRFGPLDVIAEVVGVEVGPTRGSPVMGNAELSRNASAVSDAPHREWQVDFWRRAGRVRYSCLKEAAGEEASMQIQRCCRDEKDSENR